MTKRAFLLFYFLNPFVALIAALKKYKSVSLPCVMMLFCSFYGTTQYTGTEGEFYKDSSSYLIDFYRMHDESVSWSSFRRTLLDGETSFDIAVPIVSYILAMFTKSAVVFFSVFGMIFGYFYGKNIEFMLIHASTEKKTSYSLYLVFIFALIIPFWSGLNGLRMWIAAHIYFYGCIQVLTYANRQGWLFVLLSILFHFAFASLALLFVLFVISRIKRFTSLFLCLFIITLFISSENVGILKRLIIDYTPGVYVSKVEAYTNDIYVDTFSDVKQHLSWHARWYRRILKYSIFFMIIITYMGIRRINNYEKIQEIYLSYGLLLLSYSNVVSLLPSGGRYYLVAYLFALVPIAYVYGRSCLQKWFHFTVYPLLFWTVINIRDGFDHMTLATLVSNPILTWVDFLDGAPLITLIK